MSLRVPPRSVLVATDRGPASARALEQVRYLSERCPMRIVVMHAREDLPVSDAERRGAEDELGREAATSLGYAPEAALTPGPAVADILDGAHAMDADLIVCGARGAGGRDRPGIGSVAENVVRLADRPVLIIPEGAQAMPIRTLVCPFSPGEVGQITFDYASALGAALGARLVLVHALEQVAAASNAPAGPAGAPTLTARPVGAALCPVEEVLVRGDAPAAILEAARHGRADLVVLAARRRGKLREGLFSSTTRAMLRATLSPLLVVRAPDAPDLTSARRAASAPPR